MKMRTLFNVLVEGREYGSGRLMGRGTIGAEGEGGTTSYP